VTRAGVWPVTVRAGQKKASARNTEQGKSCDTTQFTNLYLAHLEADHIAKIALGRKGRPL